MQLQNGYDVSELSNRPLHHQLLPSDHPLLPPPNQQLPQFQLFLQQQPSVNTDPFSLNFRAGMADPHINSAAAGLAPPPSVLVAPQALRWINHQEDTILPKHPPLPLWKCESESNIGIAHPQFHKPITELQISAAMVNTTPKTYTQFRDPFGSRPEFDKQNSQSPGSASEIYESTQWTPANPENTKRNSKKKKKNKHKLCTDSELKVLSGLIEAQLVAHQERLHARFTEAIERMDSAREEREDAWRAADAQAARAHAADRAREQALASTREAVIVSYLEKMTGEKIDLPTRRAEEEEEGALSGPGTGLEISKPGPKRCRDSEAKNVLLEAMLELEESNAQSGQLNHKDDHDGGNQSKD